MNMNMTRNEKLRSTHALILKNSKKYGLESIAQYDTVRKEFNSVIKFCDKTFKKNTYEVDESKIEIPLQPSDVLYQVSTVPFTDKMIETVKTTKKSTFRSTSLNSAKSLFCCLTTCFGTPETPIKIITLPKEEPVKVFIAKKPKKKDEVPTTDHASDKMVVNVKGYSSDDEKNCMSDGENAESTAYFKVPEVSTLHVSFDSLKAVSRLKKRGRNLTLLIISNLADNWAFKKDIINLPYLLRTNLDKILDDKAVCLPVRNFGNIYCSNLTFIGKFNEHETVLLLKKPIKTSCIIAQLFEKSLLEEDDEIVKLNEMVIEEAIYTADWFEHEALLVDLRFVDDGSLNILRHVEVILNIFKRKSYSNLKFIDFCVQHTDESLESNVADWNKESKIQNLSLKTVFYK